MEKKLLQIRKIGRGNEWKDRLRVIEGGGKKKKNQTVNPVPQRNFSLSL